MSVTILKILFFRMPNIKGTFQTFKMCSGLKSDFLVLLAMLWMPVSTSTSVCVQCWKWVDSLVRSWEWYIFELKQASFWYLFSAKYIVTCLSLIFTVKLLINLFPMSKFKMCPRQLTRRLSFGSVMSSYSNHNGQRVNCWVTLYPTNVCLRGVHTWAAAKLW